MKEKETKVVLGDSRDACFVITHRDSFIGIHMRFEGRVLFDTSLSDEFFPIKDFSEEALLDWGLEQFLPSFFRHWDMESDKLMLLVSLGLVDYVAEPIPASEDNKDTFYYICGVKEFVDGKVYGVVGEGGRPAMFCTQEEAFINKNKMEEEVFTDCYGLPILDREQIKPTRFFIFSVPDKYLTDRELCVKPILRDAGIDFTASVRNLKEMEEKEQEERRKEEENGE